MKFSAKDFNIANSILLLNLENSSKTLCKHDDFEDSLINYLYEDKKAPFTDENYRSDKEYIYSIIQL